MIIYYLLLNKLMIEFLVKMTINDRYMWLIIMTKLLSFKVYPLKDKHFGFCVCI